MLTTPVSHRRRRQPLSLRQEYEEFLLQRIEDYKAMLGYAGISVSLQSASSGHPAEEILDAVSSSNADIIAMCTHGRTGLDRLTNGSVVEHVLRKASRPLLVCRSNTGLQPVAVEKHTG